MNDNDDQPMMSYAQNGEDVVLQRALSDIESGFYVDVGAAFPDICSVTKHFADKGWRGINIDPLPYYMPLLEVERSNDINLGVAISDVPGTLTIYTDPDTPGNSTCDIAVADTYRTKGINLVTLDVPAMTLATLFENYVEDRDIDFLKIDVEGLEARVLKGNDWQKYRPRIIVLECNIHGVSVASETQNEIGKILTAAKYEFTLFDGLNEFWLRNEDSFRKISLSTPANILDNYILSRESPFCSYLAREIIELQKIEKQLNNIKKSRAWKTAKAIDDIFKIFKGDITPLRKMKNRLQSKIR
jgi:FkbM family methyltransferase